MKKFNFILIITVFFAVIISLFSQDNRQEYINSIKNQIKEIESRLVSIKNPVNEYIKIAHLYTEIDELDMAVEYFQKALLIEPLNANVYFKLALIYEKKKDYKKALENWENCIKYSQNKQITEIAKKHINYIKEMK